MGFCSKCGTEVAATAAFCGSCGTSVSVAAVNPLQGATSSISTQEVTEAWKTKFALLEKAGGPKLPKARELAFGDRLKILFNVWGFLFGPFYYMAKGMWKKGIVLLVLCAVGIGILEMILESMGVSDAAASTFTAFIAPVIFAKRANIDYYKKVILDDNGWW